MSFAGDVYFSRFVITNALHREGRGVIYGEPFMASTAQSHPNVVRSGRKRFNKKYNPLPINRGYGCRVLNPRKIRQANVSDGTIHCI